MNIIVIGILLYFTFIVHLFVTKWFVKKMFEIYVIDRRKKLGKKTKRTVSGPENE